MQEGLYWPPLISLQILASFCKKHPSQENFDRYTILGCVVLLLSGIEDEPAFGSAASRAAKGLMLVTPDHHVVIWF
jgi:hypothetical protein